jgi:hypothetical protein
LSSPTTSIRFNSIPTSNNDFAILSRVNKNKQINNNHNHKIPR